MASSQASPIILPCGHLHPQNGGTSTLVATYPYPAGMAVQFCHHCYQILPYAGSGSLESSQPITSAGSSSSTRPNHPLSQAPIATMAPGFAATGTPNPSHSLSFSNHSSEIPTHPAAPLIPPLHPSIHSTTPQLPSIHPTALQIPPTSHSAGTFGLHRPLETQINLMRSASGGIGSRGTLGSAVGGTSIPPVPAGQGLPKKKSRSRLQVAQTGIQGSQMPASSALPARGITSKQSVSSPFSMRPRYDVYVAVCPGNDHTKIKKIAEGSEEWIPGDEVLDSLHSKYSWSQFIMERILEQLDIWVTYRRREHGHQWPRYHHIHFSKGEYKPSEGLRRISNSLLSETNTLRHILATSFQPSSRIPTPKFTFVVELAIDSPPPIQQPHERPIIDHSYSGLPDHARTRNWEEPPEDDQWPAKEFLAPKYYSPEEGPSRKGKKGRTRRGKQLELEQELEELITPSPAVSPTASPLSSPPPSTPPAFVDISSDEGSIGDNDPQDQQPSNTVRTKRSHAEITTASPERPRSQRSPEAKRMLRTRPQQNEGQPEQSTAAGRRGKGKN